MIKKRFTLVEVLIIIVLIAVFSSIIAVNAFRAIDKAKISKLAADARALKLAWHSLYSDIGCFPTEYDYLTRGVATHKGIGPLIRDTDIVSDVLNLRGWDGPYYKGTARSPWLAPYLYDNDNNNIYDPVLGQNPYRGTNLGLSEKDFNTNVEELVPVIDEVIDDGDASTGSLRYTPAKRVFYLIYNNL